MKSTDSSPEDNKRCLCGIIGYHQDEQGHWVAQLVCGHNQHVRHDPPWMNRLWVTSASGRNSMLGYRLECKKCDEGTPKDERPSP